MIPRYEDVVARLRENGIAYADLPLSGGARLIVNKLGGHVVGPFLPDGECVMWINDAYGDSAAFKKLLGDGMAWLQGGERTFIAPEIQYLSKDRARFFETYTLQKQMYPGNYFITQSGATCRAAANMTLECHNMNLGKKVLRLVKSVKPIADPLRTLTKYKELTQGVSYIGYEQSFTLSEDIADDIVSEVWDLCQVRGGGTLYIGATPEAEFTHIYEPIGEDFQTVRENNVRLRITADRTYKIAYKAATLTGRIGYYNVTPDGKPYLFIRSFFNDPSSIYAEEPYHSPGVHGHPLSVYNDDGTYGPFGELEVNGRTIGGRSGRSSVTDDMAVWIYTGEKEKLSRIARHLIGTALD